ncbi:hypothetical protein ILUMI_20905 [Ignelater luminosus]|uniref:Band 7 domain-containing protein n=1 Tax=Ignelater luminosus TaxID=2038154 RepID=A0A8K0G1X7_IGNLU|nr:hypothetical protein ILUMI_20905 [Ignelater luminosus]
MGLIETVATVCSYLLCIVTFPFCFYWYFNIVKEYERAVIFRLGRLKTREAKGPGIFFTAPCIDYLSKVDLRTLSFNVYAQEALTKDSTNVTVEAVVFYKIENALNAIVEVADYRDSTQVLASASLRNILGSKDLEEILSGREAIANAMLEALDIATKPWGIKIQTVEVKDISLPQKLQEAMAAEAEAARAARIKVIAAEGEMKASKALKEAADVITDSPAALQLRYLQTLSNLSSEKSLVLFPLPMEILSAFKLKSAG